MNAGKIWTLISALLFGSSGAQTLNTPESKRDSSYLAPNQLPRFSDEALPVQPFWQAALSNPGHVVQYGNFLFFLLKGQLVALDMQTGKRVWKFGSNLTLLSSENASLYLADARGSVFEVDALEGKLRWSAKSTFERVDALRRCGVALCVVNGDKGGVALLKTTPPRVLWRFDADRSTGPVLEQGGVVIWEHLLGEPTFVNYTALDSRKGTVLWSSRGGFNQILRSDLGSGTLEVYQAPGISEMMDGPYNQYTLLKISTKTGETLDKSTFVVPDREGCGEPNTYTQHAILQAESLWLEVSDTCGPFIARFILGVEAKKPLLYAADGISAWLAGPLEDRLYVQRTMPQLGRMLLEGVGISSSPTLLYEYGGAPVTSLNLIDRYLFVTSLDGGFNAFVRSSAQHLLRAYLPARAFGPTLYSEGVAVVQAENTLYGFKIP